MAEEGESGLNLEPIQAVRLAMSEALLSYMNTGERAAFLGHWPPDVSTYLSDNPTPEQLLEVLTKFRCGYASSMTLLALWREHSDLFDVMTILYSASVEEKPESQFQDHGEHGQYIDHELFLVCDKNGVWYAGSPSNYIEDSKLPNPITNVYQSSDLNELLDQITKAEGGLWPSKKFIELQAKSNCLFPHIDGDAFVCPVVSKKGDEEVFKTKNSFRIKIGLKTKQAE